MTGMLNAIATTGGIFGTLVTAFILLPAVGADSILYGLGGTLMATSILLLGARRRLRAGLIVPLVVVLLGAPARRVPPTYEIVYQRDSTYHRIRVVERGPTRHLVFNRSFQGGMYRTDPLRTPYLYGDRGKVRFAEFEKYAADRYDRPIATDGVPVFSDDYAPADILPVSGWEPERW